MKKAVQSRLTRKKSIIKEVILNLIQDLQRILLTITSHPRRLLSGISTSFTTQSGGDCQLRPLGMTPNLMGFTLIELLVVVLIIGILAAVALPQYQKAVEKSRVTEALVAMDALGKCISLYVLENGMPQDAIDIEDLNCPIEVGTADDGWIKTAYYQYDLACLDTTCYVEAEPQHAYNYVLTYSPLRDIQNICWTNNKAIGQAVCKSLEAQGWQYNDLAHP